MEHNLHIYNTLTRRKKKFEAIHPPFVGMYVCGPTVYGDAHLGHARPAVTFDLVFRYLKYLGYKVRYVRNITDVGHLENDADEGEDKIAKKARLEQLEPMEVAQYYTNGYHKNVAQLNTLPPSIEPHASGHILEQIEMIRKILASGFAYESNGSVYFDVETYSQKNHYGKLSGRVVEDLLSNTRVLDGQSEKRNNADFALWKKASPEHIMRWNSEWSTGFPGWHLECSAMSTKYLGEEFDIHGGGLDLQFPHHECEIAQNKAASGKDAVKFWMHNNMITINGQKMGKSLGNFITLDDFFAGNHPMLEQAYHPMVVRFFMLQAHYRNPLDFSNSALQAAEKGLQRLLTGMETLANLKATDDGNADVKALINKFFEALDDDFNTPILIAHLFDAVKLINTIAAGNDTIEANDLFHLQSIMKDIVFDILGLLPMEAANDNLNKLSEVVDLLLNMRMMAKAEKNWAMSDKIRNELTSLGFEIKDTKTGFEWSLSK
jgi:cysteinyl-tRNA synthetase